MATTPPTVLVRQLPSNAFVTVTNGMAAARVSVADLKRRHFGWLDVVQDGGGFSRQLGPEFFQRFRDFSKRLE